MIGAILIRLTSWQCSLGYVPSRVGRPSGLAFKVSRRISDALGEAIARIASLKVDLDPVPHSPSILMCMPTFQGAQWVDEAIESAFLQKHVDWHLYIVDDGSTDSTQEILKRWKARHPDRITIHLLTENSYPSNSINHGLTWFLDHPEFEAFTLLDQDDVIMPDALWRSMRQLGPHCKVVRFKVARYNADLSEWYFNFYAWAQLLISRDVIEHVGLRKDRSVELPSDSDYLTRIYQDAAARGYSVIPTRFICQKMRVHGANQILQQATKSAQRLRRRLGM